MLRWVMRPTRSRSITGPIPTIVLPTCDVAFEERLFSAALKSVSRAVSHDSGRRLIRHGCFENLCFRLKFRVKT